MAEGGASANKGVRGVQRRLFNAIERVLESHNKRTTLARLARFVSTSCEWTKHAHTDSRESHVTPPSMSSWVVAVRSVSITFHAHMYSAGGCLKE